MSEKVRALILNPTGTFAVDKGELHDKVVSSHSDEGWDTTVDRSTVFRRNKSIHFDSLSEITRDAVRQHKPVFENGDRWIVKGLHDATPMKYGRLEDNEAVRKEAQVAKQTARLHQSEAEAMSALRMQRMVQIMWVIAMIAALFGLMIVAIIGLAVLPELFKEFAGLAPLGAAAFGMVATKSPPKREEEHIPDVLEPQIITPSVYGDLDKDEEGLLLHDCYEPGYLFISMPRRDWATLDVRGRYTSHPPKRRYLLYPFLAIFGGIIGAIVPLGIYAVERVMNGTGAYEPIPWLSVGALIMLALAHKLVRNQKPDPLWVAELIGDGELKPVMPRGLLQDYQVPTEEGGKPLPQVIRDTTLYHIRQQPHIRRLIRAKHAGNQKLMVGSLVALVAVMALLVIFLGIAMQGN